VKAAVAKNADARTRERIVIFIEVDLLTAIDLIPSPERKSSSSYPEFVKFRECAFYGMRAGLNRPEMRYVTFIAGVSLMSLSLFFGPTKRGVTCLYEARRR
jgi:hypothetical protein